MEFNMYKVGLLLLVTLLGIHHSQANTNQQEFTNRADQFFKTHVKDGRVKYENIKQNDAILQDLVSQIRNVNLTTLQGAEKKAFLINAYNILVIYQIVKNLETIQSTQAFDGFFDKFQFNVGGELMTLNKLEIKYLLKPYKDPRIHFALACGALGCPKLREGAYQPTVLEAQLNAISRKTLNDPEFIKVKGGNLEVSKIFKWYEQDFLAISPSIMAFINKYRRTPLDATLSIGYYEYDWNLNSY